MITVLKNSQTTIHTYTSPPDGEMVCSQIIETGRRLVIVDAQLLIPYAREVRSYAERLGKPIDRVIITHAHPDHWMGLEIFRDLPLYALPETRQELAKIGDYLLAYKRKTHGDLIASSLVVPAHDVQEGDVTIDGLTFRFSRVRNTEAPLMLMVELPELKVLVAQDLVYNHVYLVVGEKSEEGQYLFDGWIKCLQSLQVKGYETVLAGHGEPATPSIFQRLVEYIEYAKQLFESGINEDELKQKILIRYPGYRLPEMLDLMNLFLYHRTW